MLSPLGHHWLFERCVCLWAESKTACMMMGRAGMAQSAVRESQPQHDYYCGEDGDLKVIRVAGVSLCHPLALIIVNHQTLASNKTCSQ